LGGKSHRDVDGLGTSDTRLGTTLRILLVTDAWAPQMNGVVRTLSETVTALRARGHTIEVIAPSDGYFTLPLPTYPDRSFTRASALIPPMSMPACPAPYLSMSGALLLRKT